MQVQKISPIFQPFDRQYTEAKSLFDSLAKMFKSNKSAELEEKLIFLEIYVDLLGRIHFQEAKLKFKLFGPYKDLFRALKKALHIRLIHQALAQLQEKTGQTYASYEKQVAKDKKSIYAEAYELIMATPVKVWENLYREAFEHSQSLTPLMVNTATTQIINEELAFFKFDSETKLEAKEIKDIYEGLQQIITLENLRIASGLNATFTNIIHEHMQELSKLLYRWYQNHLILQHLTFSLSDREDPINEKYVELIKKIRSDKKKLTAKAVSQCKHLFSDILG
ncbi:hypothetical protein GCM10007049_21660 [Echinicola pacifica]|uniref:Uncharacterized protein n=1 Tax=Echinicola pacifica TaxID=346377 RepID=A0A918URI0_9BACT|nr:hypothetical protein [Echinicola pacifica]GGZ28369.1 hypothetical protein GCM10007049_21660 [Echinicola pacifica]